MLIDYPARFYGVTVLGVDEHCWRHTCGEAARTHRLTRGALHYEVHLAPHDVPHGGHVLPLVDQDGGLKPGQSLWAGPQGAHRAWRADPCAVLRMVRPSCWPAPANPKID